VNLAVHHDCITLPKEKYIALLPVEPNQPQPPSGKIDGPLLLPGMVTTSATIFNGRCAD
jgi:hypothetical protein